MTSRGAHRPTGGGALARGWVDHEPQTVVVWRAHLPIRPGSDGRQNASVTEVNAFFAAAPIESEATGDGDVSSEKWISDRAKALIKKTEDWQLRSGRGAQADGLLAPDQTVAFVLNSGGGAVGAAK